MSHPSSPPSRKNRRERTIVLRRGGGCTQANLALYWPISLVCILLKTKEYLTAGSTVITAITSFLLPWTTSRIFRWIFPKELKAVQTYVPWSSNLTLLIFKYPRPSLVVNRLSYWLVIYCSGNFCHAVRVLLSCESLVPENLHRNLTVFPSWTMYSGFTGPIRTGGPNGTKKLRDFNGVSSRCSCVFVKPPSRICTLAKSVIVCVQTTPISLLHAREARK